MKVDTLNHIKKSRFLGFILLFQAVTSLISGAVLYDPYIIEGEVSATMTSLAQHTTIIHVAIFLDILTAMGIIMLACVLYDFLKPTNSLLSVGALSMYLVEAAILITSKLLAYGLLHISKEYVATGNEQFLVLGELLWTLKDYSYSIHILPFGIGAILFYYLLYKSGLIPSWLSLWGLFSVPIILVCVMLMAYGVNIPFVVLLPYVPFEFVAGIYIMIKGLHYKEEPKAITP